MRQMTGQNNMYPKQLIQTFMEQLWNQKDLSVIDRFLSHETLIHSPMKTTQGKEEMKTIARHWLHAFPDLHCNWQDWIAEDNKVMVRWMAKGTHLGPFMEFPAIGKSVQYEGISIFQLDKEIILEYWGLVDRFNLIQQLKSIC
ncbi:MAG: ester cyclase [Legionella sp.]|nr:ester cyclase [Legionella sp.]